MVSSPAASMLKIAYSLIPAREHVSYHRIVVILNFVNFSAVKALAVGWQCATPSTTTTTTTTTTTPSPVCNVVPEHSPLTVSCATGQISNVLFASYGTPSGSCATGFQVNQTCNAASALAYVTSHCVGAQTCTITADNTVFTDPCYGTLKKLAIKVECGFVPTTTTPAPTTPSPTCTYVAESRVASLTCGSGIISEILYASYGTPTGSCSTGFTTSTCSAAKSAALVAAQCVGKSSCSITASNAVFTDPCTGTLKALAIQVACNASQASSMLQYLQF